MSCDVTDMIWLRGVEILSTIKWHWHEDMSYLHATSVDWCGDVTCPHVIRLSYGWHEEIWLTDLFCKDGDMWHLHIFAKVTHVTSPHLWRRHHICGLLQWTFAKVHRCGVFSTDVTCVTYDITFTSSHSTIKWHWLEDMPYLDECITSMSALHRWVHYIDEWHVSMSDISRWVHCIDECITSAWHRHVMW